MIYRYLVDGVAPSIATYIARHMYGTDMWNRMELELVDSCKELRWIVSLVQDSCKGYALDER